MNNQIFQFLKRHGLPLTLVATFVGLVLYVLLVFAPEVKNQVTNFNQAGKDLIVVVLTSAGFTTNLVAFCVVLFASEEEWAEIKGFRVAFGTGTLVGTVYSGLMLFNLFFKLL